MLLPSTLRSRYSSNPAYHCCLIPACLSTNRSATCQCLGGERAGCISDNGRVNMTVLSSTDGQQWTHVRSVWSGPSGYSSLQVLQKANVTVAKASGSNTQSSQGSHFNAYGCADRVGLLWEAWANFSMRDFPTIRYIDIDVTDRRTNDSESRAGLWHQ